MGSISEESRGNPERAKTQSHERLDRRVGFCVFAEIMLDQLTILAPGLHGASVARAAKARGAARRIVIWARRAETRLALADQPWCTRLATRPRRRRRGPTWWSSPPRSTGSCPWCARSHPSSRKGAVVCDVGSVKGEISRQGHEATRGTAHFVGAHPMAGSEKTGWEHGTPDLFEGRTCFVTPVDSTHPEALKKVVAFWRDLGAEVVTIDPDKHDEIVAHISHLPQVLASSLCAFLSARDPGWRNFAGGGLQGHDEDRGSDPKLWRTILEENRDEVLRALREFQDELQGLQAALANRDYVEVTARLERGAPTATSSDRHRDPSPARHPCGEAVPGAGPRRRPSRARRALQTGRCFFPRCATARDPDRGSPERRHADHG
jgi:cyclohexadieny/prephenate dehydrogenase